MGVGVGRGLLGVEAGTGRGVDTGSAVKVFEGFDDGVCAGAVTTGLTVGCAPGVDAGSAIIGVKVIAAVCQISARLPGFMSNSIAARLGFAGSAGSLIAFPFIDRFANGALVFA